MSELDSYLLEFLIDGTQINCDTLKKAVAKALGKYASKAEWKVVQATSQHFKLSISGPLKDVDTYHDRINKKFMDHYSCIRLRDEAGNEIREQAYPILARIEQQLRAFINRAMIEVKGFDWWDSITPSLADQTIRDDVQRIEKLIGETASALHHPLELTLFEDLICIVTGSIQCWPTGKPLSADDLLEVISGCFSLDDLYKKLAEKTRKISLWDEVFARYFDDVDKWKELTMALNDFVIPVRNKVMHHRPMRLRELQTLKETKQNLDTLLASAATKLSEEERAQALQVSENWLSALVESIRPVPKINEVVGAFWKQQEEWARALREPGNAIQRFGQLLRDQQEQISLGIESLRLSSVAQLATSSPTYIGNTASMRFHRPLCRHNDQILPENRIRFANRDEAVAKGYVPCQACKP